MTFSDPTHIVAIFQGRDGSLGYRNNRIYHLAIYKNVDGGWLVQSTGKEIGCIYAGEKSFLKNWMTSRKVLIEKIGHTTI